MDLGLVHTIGVLTSIILRLLPGADCCKLQDDTEGQILRERGWPARAVHNSRAAQSDIRILNGQKIISKIFPFVHLFGILTYL